MSETPKLITVNGLKREERPSSKVFEPATFPKLPVQHEYHSGMPDIVSGGAYFPNVQGEVFVRDNDGRYVRAGHLLAEASDVQISVQQPESPAEPIDVRHD